jgi:hypothetical protein
MTRQSAMVAAIALLLLFTASDAEDPGAAKHLDIFSHLLGHEWVGTSTSDEDTQFTYQYGDSDTDRVEMDYLKVISFITKHAVIDKPEIPTYDWISFWVYEGALLSPSSSRLSYPGSPGTPCFRDRAILPHR